MQTVIVVASCESYRTGDFIRAAREQRINVVVATDAPSPFDDQVDRTIFVDLDDFSAAGAAIALAVPEAQAVVAVDDQGVMAAAHASLTLGLPTNPLGAVEATRDKLAMRRLLRDAGIPQPRFEAVAISTDGHEALTIGYPMVLKPVDLSASRGVIRVDNDKAFIAAERRIRDILRTAGRDPSVSLIVEEYIDGEELVVEGIIVEGDLEVLAVIDKPEPLVGPFFEETIFTTPSRMSGEIQEAAIDMVRRAINALSIQTGPVHAELRIDADGNPWIIEIAARSIGGLCGRSLSFGLLNESLESVVLRSAIGRQASPGAQSKPASGVMMLPIPAAGVLTAVDGIDAATEIPGIDGIEITVPIGRHVIPLPEGDRYLGFIFASGASPEDVDTAIQLATQTLDITIDGESIFREPAKRSSIHDKRSDPFPRADVDVP